MTSAISGNYGSSYFQMTPPPKPDAGKLASKLFSQLDSSSQGYIQKSDLQSAFDTLSGSSSDTTSSNVDELFSQLDSDSDGKVTESEFTSGFKKLADELDSQFAALRQNGMDGRQGGMGGMSGMGNMPPPPPQDDQGFTKDELTSQLSEIGSSDSQRSSLINKIVNNFDKADSNSDGKVSFQEAMAYDQSTSGTSSSGSTSSASTSDTSSTTTGTTASASTSEAKLMMQIMQLMHAYGGFGQDGDRSSLTSLLSTSA